MYEHSDWVDLHVERVVNGNFALPVIVIHA